ncbi:mechanosensitive ion channel family protein [Streptacidiphilus sp. ASG 303]|uniref:mechanosensitive ion channel family protein n=1 Tax=Streptacidiphilus sp. ASG 303 TaxID=2896847 RepID=UPI001E39CE33|nr:mechanosensitive ion channel family protein [Streptacidiphilus sp. ASG 303]MCD0481613.1 mechanosensitive ion channel family protein [Streptacidiphilus sp. ASG 303]
MRPLALLCCAVAVPALVGWGVDRLLRRAMGSRPGSRTLPLLRRCRMPLQALVAAAWLYAALPAAGLPSEVYPAARHTLLVLVMAASGWLGVRVTGALVTTAVGRYENAVDDHSRVRRMRTQVGLIRRVVQAAIVLVAIASALMTFPAARAVGTSLLASAGVIGVVAGIAAQSTLGNLFAGLQIAFGDMVRIGDVVVVNGQQGQIEEITLTYLVLTTWDQRRIVMPVSYFTGRPFENWSRKDPRMTGTVILHLDHAAPIGELRAELKRYLDGNALWDRQGWSLLVTDTTPSTVVVRALMTARDADDVWTLRCAVREHLLEYVRERHPQALPRVATTVVAAGGPEGHGAEDQAAQERGTEEHGVGAPWAEGPWTRPEGTPHERVRDAEGPRAARGARVPVPAQRRSPGGVSLAKEPR